MGVLTHVCEAEYFFPQGTDLQVLNNAAKQAFESIQGCSSGKFELKDSSADLFRRPGDLHNVRHAYEDGKEDANVELIWGVCTSTLWGFKDDVACTFYVKSDGRVAMKALSVSRVGEGDIGKNKKNVDNLVLAIQKISQIQTTGQNIIRS